MTAGGPGLVAVGSEVLGGDSDAAVWVSADGYAWTRVDGDGVLGGAGAQWLEWVVAGGPGLVALGNGEVWVSVDGYTWIHVDDEAVFDGLGAGVVSMTAGGPGLVAVGFIQSTTDCSWGGCHFDGAVWVSADGYTWTHIDDDAMFGGPGDQAIFAVTAGGPGLVAIGQSVSNGWEAVVWQSTDGYTWTRIDDPGCFGVSVLMAAWERGLVAFSDVGADQVACVSPPPG